MRIAKRQIVRMKAPDSREFQRIVSYAGEEDKNKPKEHKASIGLVTHLDSRNY
jgi:hypothetical protein